MSKRTDISDKKLPLKVAICDDEEKDLIILKDFIDNYYYHSGYIFEKVSILSPSDPDFIENLSSYDLYFLDMEMPDISGLDIAQLIRDKKTSMEAKIVFVSNYPEYMHDSFSVHPFHYLQKPITRESIFDVLDAVIKEYFKSSVYIELILEDLSVVSISVVDIMYINAINARKRLLAFHTANKTYIAKGVLSDYIGLIEKYTFVPCYRGYLVNIIQIHYLDPDSIVLKNKERIPASQKHLGNIRRLFVNRILNSTKGIS